MATWTKTNKEDLGNGEYNITWTIPGTERWKIISKRRLIPHANGEGAWLHTSYWVRYPDGSEEEFYLMVRAKMAVEEAICAEAIEKLGGTK